MNELAKRITFYYFLLLTVSCFIAFGSTTVFAGDYDNALKGVSNYDVVFDVSQGNPKVANIVFWAVKNSYEVPEVKNLKKSPNVAVVFHGPVVKLISSNQKPFNAEEWAEVEKFQETLRQMKKDGVKLEVCLYAAKVMNVDTKTIMPEIDQVGNGFVSVIGYQQQGYSVVRIP